MKIKLKHIWVCSNLNLLFLRECFRMCALSLGPLLMPYWEIRDARVEVSLIRDKIYHLNSNEWILCLNIQLDHHIVHQWAEMNFDFPPLSALQLP